MSFLKLEFTNVETSLIYAVGTREFRDNEDKKKEKGTTNNHTRKRWKNINIKLLSSFSVTRDFIKAPLEIHFLNKNIKHVYS